MLQEILKTERHAGVVRLTLRRPERGNSLSPDLVDMLAEQVRISYQDGTRLLVLESEGKHFCTGFDLSDLDAVTDDDLLARFARIELLLQRCMPRRSRWWPLVMGASWVRGLICSWPASSAGSR